ncbi:MAG: spore gernimation protein GerC [Paenibacillus sp.]|jgi:spore germination protein KC|nr:spore gernimation protein GerC [Paenibacillus sp.]
MDRKTFVACILVVCTLVLTACWDRRELNDLAIAVGIGLDKSGSNLRVSTQIVNPSEVASKRGGGGYSTPVTILHAEEPTISEAIRKLTTVSPRKIFSSHLRVLVIGEQLARQGIENVLDGLSRHHEFRSDFYLVVAKGTTADAVLQIITPIEKIPANKMFNTLELSEKEWAPSTKMPLDNLISDLSSPTKDVVLTGIRITGDQQVGITERNVDKSNPYANLQYTGLALFKDDKLVDWFNDEESKGYNYIVGNVRNTVGHLTCPDGGMLAVEVDRTQSKVKGKLVRGTPQITVELSVEQNISEVQCSIDLTKLETISELEKISSATLKEIMMSAIRKAQKNGTDIFGFGEAVEDADPRSWLKIREDWDQYFKGLKVAVKVDVQIRRLGTTTNALPERKE